VQQVVIRIGVGAATHAARTEDSSKRPAGVLRWPSAVATPVRRHGNDVDENHERQMNRPGTLAPLESWFIKPVALRPYDLSCRRVTTERLGRRTVSLDSWPEQPLPPHERSV